MTRGLEENTGGYKGSPGFTRGYRRLEGFTRGYRVRSSYRGL